MSIEILATIATFASLALTLLSRNYIEKTNATRYMTLMIVFASLWSLSNVIVPVEGYPAVINTRLTFIFAYAMSIYMLLFVSEVTDKHYQSLVRSLALLSSIILPLALVTDGLVPAASVVVHNHASGILGTASIDFGPLYYPVMALIVPGPALAVRMSYRKKSLDVPHRTLFIGVVAGVVASFATNAVLPALYADGLFWRFAFISLALWATSMTFFALTSLKKSNASLEMTNDSKDEFISLASHQLRTPLSVAAINNKMILDGRLSKKEQLEAVQENQQNIEHMATIVDELLEAARIDNGTFKITKTKFDLQDATQAMINRHQTQAKAKKIKIKFTNKLSAKTILADETKLSEVISNLIDNAIKYSPKGSTVEVHASSTQKEFTLKVKDQGIGVPESEQSRLFEKFNRSDSAKSLRPEGLGLGLYLAKKTIDTHGGEMVFEDRKASGSVFGFTVSRGSQ